MNDRVQRRLDQLVERIQKARKGMGKGMWYMAFTDTMMDLLPTKGSFTHAELKAELERRRDEHADEPILHAAYSEALEVLEDHRPR